MSNASPQSVAVAIRPPPLRLLLRLKLAILRNRLGQLVDQSPLRLLLIISFVAGIWAALYTVFDNALRFMGRFEQSAIAIPYVFNIFFVAMTLLLAFSTAVLAYAALFNRAEPSFLLTTPHTLRDIVVVMYVESLFFASWSLLLLGVPLMLAVGQVLNLSWLFYLTFISVFLGFVPIPGALGLLVALLVALWLPRVAKRTLFYSGGIAILLAVVWWGRLWAASATASQEWLVRVLAEFEYFKAALLPSTWVANAIDSAYKNKPADAAFYTFVTLSTSLFFSWIAINLVERNLLVAFGRASAAPLRTQVRNAWGSRLLTNIAFCYLPDRMRALILKDIRNFLRDPVQWSQLAILFGLLSLYLIYLPKVRPEGFTLPWQAMICFLNYGAITLILSTFTSRFVFPMISMEGRQIWLVGLWPMPRSRVLWAKFIFALTITTATATVVTLLAIKALDLPWTLGLVQLGSTLAACVGLCSLAVGLGAKLPSYHEADSGRIASGLGGTVNLIASVALVTVNVVLFGGICYNLVGIGRLDTFSPIAWLLLIGLVLVCAAASATALSSGLRSFRRQEF